MSQTATITATYAGAPVPDNPWWVRLEQIPVTNDVATVGDTANLLDALYQVDPCTEAEASTETETEDDLTTEDVADAAGKTLDLAACAIAPDGSCEVQIKVIRSHQTEPYRLHVAGGSVIETVVVEEEIVQNIAVSEATETELEYPVIAAFTASWMADLATAAGRRPTIQRNGNMLNWDGSATGTLRAAYLTVYDLVTIKVNGVDGELGEALIRVVFHSMAEELTPELPDPAEMDRSLCGGSATLIIPKDRVTCYKAITVEQLCSCSKDKVGSYTYEQIVDCPDWVTRCPGGAPDCMALLGSETIKEYVECAGDNQVSGTGRVWNVSSPDYYRATCCDDPPKKLPHCYEQITSYSGGKDIVNGRQFWRDLYGPLTQFTPVSPPGGICGKHITRQVVRSGNCCEGVPALEWDGSVSPEVMAPNSAVVIGVTGGGPYPYQWRVIGEGYQFGNGSKKITTTSRTVRLSALTLACGTAEITCTDGCTTTRGYIRSSSGRWVLVYNQAGGYPGTPPVLLPGTDVRPVIGDNWREGVRDRWKIRQLFNSQCQCYGQCYAVRGTYAEALAQCAAWTAYSACSTLAEWYAAGYFSGSCFDDPPRCGTCGSCGEMPDNTYFSYALGPHSQVYYSQSLGGYAMNCGHVGIVQTEVYEWQC